MKRYILFGLTALGLVALAPTESKADDGLRVYVNPGYQQGTVERLDACNRQIPKLRG